MGDGKAQFELVNALCDSGKLAEMTEAEVKVWLVLVRHHNEKHGTCHPTQERIAKMAGLRREAVYRALARLEEKGLVEVFRLTARAG